MAIYLVGLSPGDPGQLTVRAVELLQNAEAVYLRTKRHPTVKSLPAGPTYHSFDEVYEQEADFAAVYRRIVDRLIALAEGGEDVVYAVPGDPLVGEGTVTLLLEACRQRGIETVIVSGLSFVEPTLALLGVDALDGLQVVDATDLAMAYHPSINPDHPALVAQLYSRRLAADVKLTLMNQYPDEHPVKLVFQAGTADRRVESLPLYEIDRQELDHLTTLYVPPFAPSAEAVASFEGFQNTIAHLRAPEGCPWDREQTHESLRRNLIEEAYEVVDAIDSGDPEKLREELGDLLIQVVLHGQVAVDEGEFLMGDVIREVDEKIKRRHPHVWGDVEVNGSAEQVSINWEKIKAQEREQKGEPEKSILDGISKSLPALHQANEYDVRAVRVGFDWQSEEGVLDKIQEEIEEVLAAETPDEKFWEIGDLLLVVAVWARWLQINPEDALRAANQRFYDRFTQVERRVRQQGRSIADLSESEMLAIWEDAKRALSAGRDGR
jgi:tetrapyrrole methylase family protein/MazG family protein